MKSMSKRGEDRISALPKSLICHILSFIPTVEAVRTTVLSKSWNRVWTGVTTLDFNDDRDVRRFLDFDMFVNRVLSFRDATDIQKFKLETWHLDDLDVFEGWIYAAMWRNVQELHIAFRPGATYYVIPGVLFDCKSLRALRLEIGANPIRYDCPPPWSFRKLKFFHVTFDNPDDELAERIFSCCPVVEAMIIDGQANAMQYEFIVGAPELKSLTISLDDPDENDFQINAPNLENLVLKSVSLSNYNLQSVRSLDSASISFVDISVSEKPSFPTRATALLAGISDVKCLSLSIHSFEVSYLPAAFINLKKLDLLLHKLKYWELLAELLNRAPQLEDLVLEDKTECGHEHTDFECNPPEAVPVCLLSQLKTITIKGFKGQRVEMGVVKYLLNNGHVLTELTLYSGLLPAEANEMYKKFLMFRMAKGCVVKFRKM
ncbi:F-box/FBD/LRR-repeat protein At3g52680-like [Argentina anserina]|uniref:F-box/FBD/LRR-repeat protein At3g52680-like n=1 Tax=Argentina anserina TaxID=57926 RepID=UPI0021765063|nr:F-box/FBD/LRR-repeat protein At3g52680-like [Potentilla anserina]